MNKILTMLLTLTLAFPSFTGQGTDDPTRWAGTKQLSFREAAAVLTELGITGITDALIGELEAFYQDAPEGMLYNGTADILFMVGVGETDYNTMEWTPSCNGVYSFDAEVFDLSKMYTNFLIGIQSLDPETIRISDIVEDQSGADWPNGTGTIKVSFTFNGSPYEVNAQVMYDWFDVNVANAVGEIIQADNKRLWFASDGYQACIVFFRDKAWAQQFVERTGLQLVRRFE